MGKFSDILFVSDFDRTLTDTDDRVVPRNIDAIRYFMDEGGAFTIATGRSHFMLRERAKDVPVNAPQIMSNGAISYDYDTGETFFAHGLPDSARDVARALIAKYPDARIELQSIEGHYVFGEDPLRDQFMNECKTVPRRAPIDEVPDPILKIAVIGRVVRRDDGVIDLFAPCSPEEDAYYDGMIDYIANRPYGAEYEIMRTAPRIVEFQRVGVSKGISARELAEKLGRPVLVCAGDAPNDISMLLEADHAFVPSSGTADVVAMDFQKVDHCDDGAIAHIVAILDDMRAKAD